MKKLISAIGFVAIVCPTAHAQYAPRERMHLAAEALLGARLNEEMSRQSRIFHSKGDDVPQGYVIDRSLLSYTFTLPAEFDRSLANLGANDRWLDIGAGQGQAILDYFGERYDAMHTESRDKRAKKAQVVGISIEDRRTPAWRQVAAKLEKDKIQYLHGRRLREFASGELGQFRLITDLLGGFSYTEYLSLFMEKVLDLLEVNGTFYTLLQDVHYETGANRPHHPDSTFQTQISNIDGSEGNICSWLKSIGCVEVTCEQKPHWTPPIEVYSVRKVCNEVAVPALVTTFYEAGTPPERRFKVSNTPPQLPPQAGVGR